MTLRVEGEVRRVAIECIFFWIAMAALVSGCKLGIVWEDIIYFSIIYIIAQSKYYTVFEAILSPSTMSNSIGLHISPFRDPGTALQTLQMTEQSDMNVPAR